MCGIFGIVTKEESPLGIILTEAAKRLTYRGYDSVGVATLNGNRIDLRKDAGRVEEVASKYAFAEMKGKRGITQLRWATFGEPSQINAQPHLDSDGDMVGAHNGNVVNNAELRRQFTAEGLTVRSENDGESCVHAVERYVKRGEDFIQAIRHAFHDLEGDYAFVIGSIHEETLYAVKKGSGLVAGIGEGFTCLSSDLPSILPLTRRVLRIEDGEIAILRAESLELVSINDGKKIQRESELVEDEMEAVQKGGFDHFMLKEIHEQPATARALLHALHNKPDLEEIVTSIKNARHVYLIGCGTSYNACQAGSVDFARLARRSAIPVVATQFVQQYLPAVNAADVGIFVSQSGETKDVLNALKQAQSAGMTCFGVANVIGSTMTRMVSRWLPLCCGYEISVPATKTFINQGIALLYLACRVGNLEVRELDGLPEALEQTIQTCAPQINEVVPTLAPWNDFFCLGYGSTYAYALEGALKIKEVTYAHCEGMLSTEFKHGPLAAVSQGYPVIFLAGREDVPLIVSGLNEVACRGGHTIVIGEKDVRLKMNATQLISIPSSPALFAPILSVIPLQLIAYQLAVTRGYDPDFPRNLSKTLTVD